MTRRQWICLSVLAVVGAVVVFGVTTVLGVRALLTALPTLSGRIGAAPGTVPDDVRTRIEGEYLGFKVHRVFYVNRGEPGRTIAVVMESKETTGFRHLAVYDVIEGPGNTSIGQIEAEDWLLNAWAEEYDGARAAKFEKIWVATHPDLICGDVLPTEDVLTRADASSWEAEAWSVEPGTEGDRAVYVPTGAFKYAWVAPTQTWGPLMMPGLAGSGSMTDEDARRAVGRAYPRFEVERVVRRDHVLVGQGAVTVVVESRDVPGFRWAVDAAATKTSASGDWYGGSTRDFLSSGSPRAKAFMKAWATQHPGSVVQLVAMDYQCDPDMSVTVEYADSLKAYAEDAECPGMTVWAYYADEGGWEE